MREMSVDSSQAARAATIFVATTLAIVGVTTLVFWLTPFAGFLRVVAGLWVVATLFVTPFWVVPLHLRLQRPRDASAALAFWTGIPAWLIGAAHAVHSSVMTFGP
jgi:hypothetical protein